MTAELIARLKTAPAPCRKLDLEISVAVNYRGMFAEPGATYRWGAGGDEIEVLRQDGRKGCLDPVQFVPRWTSSVDAALTLIPSGCQWTVEADAAWIRWLTAKDVGEAQSVFFGRGGTATARAIAAASMDALAKRKQEAA